MHKTICILLFPLFIYFTGCTTAADNGTFDFGADYSVIVSDDFPSLINNQLNVEVQYSGCNPNHEFSLSFLETQTNEFEVWLTKITPNEDCDAIFEEMRVFDLPRDLHEGRLTFIGPGVQIVLREG